MKKIYILFLLVTILFVSCKTVAYYSPKAISKIEVGMSKDKISSIFGSPGYRHLNGEIEKWEYRYEDVEKTGTNILLVHFKSGVVEGMDSFFEPVTPNVVFPHPHPRPPHSHKK